MTLYFLKKIKTSTALPLTIGEIKVFLRIDHDDEDELLRTLTHTAMTRLEQYTGMSIMEQHWHAVYCNETQYYIMLPKHPIQKIISVQLVDISGVKRALPETMYSLDDDVLYFSITPCAFMTHIHYVAGIGIVDDIEHGVKTALLEMVANMYENRGVISDAFMRQYDYMKIRRVR